jgi:hypothetical protein
MKFDVAGPTGDTDGAPVGHALRQQFVSNLAAAGVHPKAAQILARHPNIPLTMDRYTYLGLLDTSKALDKLPALPSIPPKRRTESCKQPARKRLLRASDRALTKAMRVDAN